MGSLGGSAGVSLGSKLEDSSSAVQPHLPDTAAPVAPGSKVRSFKTSGPQALTLAQHHVHDIPQSKQIPERIQLFPGERSVEGRIDPILDRGSFKIFGPSFQTRPGKKKYTISPRSTCPQRNAKKSRVSDIGKHNSPILGTFEGMYGCLQPPLLGDFLHSHFKVVSMLMTLKFIGPAQLLTHLHLDFAPQTCSVIVFPISGKGISSSPGTQATNPDCPWSLPPFSSPPTFNPSVNPLSSSTKPTLSSTMRPLPRAAVTKGPKDIVLKRLEV